MKTRLNGNKINAKEVDNKWACACLGPNAGTNENFKDVGGVNEKLSGK